MVREESTESAGVNPKSGDDQEAVTKLAAVTQLMVPGTDVVEVENDEGGYYYHLADPHGHIDYIIEPVTENRWRGIPNGTLGLLRPFTGPSAGVVATLASLSISSYLASITREVTAIIFGG